MRKLTVALLCFALILPAQAESMLPPGKPAGVKPAQAENLAYIYGGVILFAAILFAFIGTTGNAPISTAPTSTN